MYFIVFFFFFQAEDGIRDRSPSRGLGDVYKRQTFDSISVRFGYMFLPDVAKATAEFARVLKPGGRLCSSVWVKPEENPWTTIAMQAIATEAVLAPPDPDGPNMFR